MCYFGFKDIEEQNLSKAIEYLNKRINITQKMYHKKFCAYYKYNMKKLMFGNKLISNDELIKEKRELIEFFYPNLNLKYQTIDNYVIGEDFYEGITTQKDVSSALILFQSGQNIFCMTIIDCLTKSKMKKFLKFHEKEMENKFKEEICCICYTNKPNKIFIPCKHNFCDFCAEKLEKESKCTVCRGKVLVVV